MAQKTVWNFGAGPAKIPDAVLKKANDEFLNYKGTGCSVMELSHRGKEFLAIIEGLEAKLRKVVGIPDNYSVIFMEGGATTQFAAVPLNLMKNADAVVDYAVTGAWSTKAVKEAAKFSKNVNKAIDTTDSKHTSLPPQSEWKTSKDAAYFYYCDNETVHGVEWNSVPEVPSTLVCDMSSNFLSRPIDVTKYGCIVACSQKNMGCAGLTTVIVKTDLLGTTLPGTPSMLDYKVFADAKNIYNTPDTWAIYIADLVLDWVIEQGGLEAIAKMNAEKAGIIQNAIANSDGFYTTPVAAADRSKVNIPMRLKGNDEALEAKFLAEATAAGFLQLKGHRSVGGIRVSLYNANPLGAAQALASFMEKFAAENGGKAAAPAAAPAAAGGEKYKVLVMDKCDPKAVAILTAAGHTAEEKEGLKEDELVKIIPEYAAMIVRSATTVTEPIIRAGKNLKIIGRAGVGVDNIKIPIATECGIHVVNSPQGNTISAAEHTWGLILAMARKVPQAYTKLKVEKVWDRKSFVGCELSGRTLAILGFGNVGKTVGKYALAFGMKVIAHDPFVSKEQGAKFGATMMELDECLANADVITMHLPSIPSTQKMINEKTISTMRKGVMLANVGRGECVNDEDLAAALKSGRVAAAALDVFAPEPLAADSPYYGCDNVVLTPHLGASTKEAQVKVAIDVSEQICDVLGGGKPRTPVNKLA